LVRHAETRFPKLPRHGSTSLTQLMLAACST
jgi:hypothetical protein